MNLDQALAFARHIQTQGGGRAGEIAFVGTGRTAERESGGAPAPPRNLRVLLVPDAVENAGLRKIGMRRATADPDLWEIFVEAHNYGSQPRNVTVSIDFGPPGKAGRFRSGSQQLTLPPGGDKEAGFDYRTAAAGVLGVTSVAARRLSRRRSCRTGTACRSRALPVTVYSERAGPAAAGCWPPRRGFIAVYRKPAEYRPDDQGLVILDRFAPPQRPAGDSIWIDPPAAGIAHSRAQDRGPGAVPGLGCPDIRRRRDCAPRISSWRRRSVFEPAAG